MPAFKPEMNRVLDSLVDPVSGLVSTKHAKLAKTRFISGLKAGIREPKKTPDFLLIDVQS
jgi:hypothetical protein